MTEPEQQPRSQQDASILDKLIKAMSQESAENYLRRKQPSRIKANLRRYEGYPYSPGVTEDPESEPSDN